MRNAAFQPVPAFDTAALRQRDSAHFIHPFTDHKALSATGARVIVRGEGIHVWDSEGNRIIDGMSGLWCVNAGYGRASIADAVHRQLSTLPFYNSFFNTTNIPALELAERLAHLAPPGFEHVFFTGSGSEANDTNIRLVRRYWQLKGEPKRQVIISRHNAYHGSTVAASALGGMGGMHEQGGTVPGVAHIGQPNYAGDGRGMTVDAFARTAAGWLEEEIVAIGAENVAAFIGEPVQGAGGVIIPPPGYWPEIQRICDKYSILLIADEVITGFGRLGAWFGSTVMGIRPDLITFAKGVTSGYIPLGGVLVGERVAEVLIGMGGDFNHGFTYSGHPAACAAALENLRILEEENLPAQVGAVTGPYLARAFAALADHPLVGYADSLGFTAGLNLVKVKAQVVHDNVPFPANAGAGMICRGHMFNNGVIMRAVGDRMIIAPPLIMSTGQIDEMVDTIRFCLDLTLADLRSRGLL